MALTPTELRERLGAKTEIQKAAKMPHRTTPQPSRRVFKPKLIETRGKEQNRRKAVSEAPQVELAVLAALYQHPHSCFPLFDKRAKPDFFANPVRRIVFNAMSEYMSDHDNVDPTAFLQHLIDSGQFERVGGGAFLADLLSQTSPIEAFDYHLDILRDKYIGRETKRLADGLSARIASTAEDEMWALIAEHEDALRNLRALATDSLEGVENFDYNDLVAFDSKLDDSVLIGSNRWLGKGYTCLWAGGSGYGKSSLEMQAALYWAAGVSLFGIKPVRPLKSLIVQAENDLGDTAEQFQGVVAGIKATGDVTLNGEVERMVVVVRLIGCRGDKFLARLVSLLQLHKPELVWIDPLFAFAGCDLLDTEAISHFIRDGLIPIAVEHQVCAHVIHHVSKPARENDSKTSWSPFDYQYLGFGSSEIQNAFRAVNILIPVAGHDGVFRLVLSKRGERAGARDLDREFTTSIYLCHAKEGQILWSQVDKPQEVSRDGKRRQDEESGKFVQKFSVEDLLDQMNLISGLKTNALLRHACSETGMSKQTFYRLYNQAKATSQIKLGPEGWTKTS